MLGKIFTGTAATALCFFAVLLSWGLLEPYNLDTEEEQASIPNLPSEWEGARIAQLSDFQVGMWMDNTATISRSIDRIINERPEALFITGDFIYNSASNPESAINEVAELLKPLSEAGIPTFAVLGNHDYGLKDETRAPNIELAMKIEQALEESGVKVLHNEVFPLSPTDRNSALNIVGIGSHWADEDRVEQALLQLSDSDPRVVLMHNPDSFIAFPANTAPLAVAGHTHGGQIRIPFIPQWSWLSLAKTDSVFADEWTVNVGKPGNELYVNRGIGFSYVPLRINCPPEPTYFILAAE